MYMDWKEKSFEMAKRLRELREEKGLSHADLAGMIKDRYGVTISRDSLINYEIADEHRTRAQSLPNLKMKTEYLLCLGDFYDVSIDYLTGQTSDRKRIPSAVDALGLTENAVLVMENLSRAACKDWTPEHIDSVRDRFIDWCYSEGRGLVSRCDDDLFAVLAERHGTSDRAALTEVIAEEYLLDEVDCQLKDDSFQSHMILEFLNLVLEKENEYFILRNLASYVLSSETSVGKVCFAMSDKKNLYGGSANAEIKANQLSQIFLLEAEQSIRKLKELAGKYQIWSVDVSGVTK